MFQSPPKWLLGSRNARYRLAIVLLAMTVLVLGSKLLEDTFIERLRYDCHSLFADRLRPATIVFHLSDQMHQKQSLLSRYLAQPDARRADAAAIARDQLKQHDQRIDQLLEEFHGTYLVGNEAQYLRDLRGALQRYRTLEGKFLAQPETVTAGSDEALLAAWRTVRDELLALSQLQEEVGQELDRESEAYASGVTLLLYLQIAVAFVLGLIAAALASSLGNPRSPPSPNDPNLH